MRSARVGRWRQALAGSGREGAGGSEGTACGGGRKKKRGRTSAMSAAPCKRSIIKVCNQNTIEREREVSEKVPSARGRAQRCRRGAATAQRAGGASADAAREEREKGGRTLHTSC